MKILIAIYYILRMLVLMMYEIVKVIFLIFYKLICNLIPALKQKTPIQTIIPWFTLTTEEKENYLNNKNVPKALVDLYTNKNHLVYNTEVFFNTTYALNNCKPAFASLAAELIKMFAHRTLLIYANDNKSSYMDAKNFLNKAVYHLFLHYPKLMLAYLQNDDEEETLTCFFMETLVYKYTHNQLDSDVDIYQLKDILTEIQPLSPEDKKRINNFFIEIDIAID